MKKQPKQVIQFKSKDGSKMKDFDKEPTEEEKLKDSKWLEEERAKELLTNLGYIISKPNQNKEQWEKEFDKELVRKDWYKLANGKEIQVWKIGVEVKEIKDHIKQNFIPKSKLQEILEEIMEESSYYNFGYENISDGFKGGASPPKSVRMITTDKIKQIIKQYE